jgi:peptidoglycan hydrolase CwlO-like protein
MANSYVEKAQETLNKLITSKVELHRTKNALEDQLDSLKDRSAVAEQAVTTLQRENARLEKVLSETGTGAVELNEGNLDSMVYPKDPFSAK